MDDIEQVARFIGAVPSEVCLALDSAIRRSEPDAREVYGLISGYRFGARRANVDAEWQLALERRPQPWERAPRTGWSS